jgi:cell division protease FtsH
MKEIFIMDKNIDNKKKKDNEPKKPPRDRKKKDDEFQWKKASKTGLIWVLILLSAIFFSKLWPDNRPNEVEVDLTVYQQLVKEDKIESGRVTLHENLFNGILKQEGLLPGTKTTQRSRYFRTVLPYIDDTIVEEWKNHNIRIRIVEPSDQWTLMLIQMLPWLVDFYCKENAGRRRRLARDFQLWKEQGENAHRRKSKGYL